MQRIRDRGQELGIKRFSVMPIPELKGKIEEAERMIEEAEKKLKYEKTVTCQACLEERRKQRLIDDKLYDWRCMDNLIRKLVCTYCKHDNFAVDGDIRVCVACGTVEDTVSTEGDYTYNRVKHR